MKKLLIGLRGWEWVVYLPQLEDACKVPLWAMWILLMLLCALPM